MSGDPTATATHGVLSEKTTSRLLGSMSVFTMLMTVLDVAVIAGAVVYG